MPGKPKDNLPRKLSSIFKRVLDWVRAGDYEDYGVYMRFGTPDELSDEVTAASDRASKALQQHASRVRTNRRTTLNKDPDLETHLRNSGGDHQEQPPKGSLILQGISREGEALAGRP